MNAISLILNSTYFKFDNKFFKQIFGLSMGSPLSPILANLVIHDLEMSILSNINVNIPIYYRYIDDMLIALPKNQMYLILEVFNL